MLATKALAANRESKTVGEMSGLLATMKWIAQQSVDQHSIPQLKYNDNTADSFRWG